jgi:hypothetical protein
VSRRSWGGGARSGSRPRRRFPARRSPVCRTWWRRRGTGRRPAPRCCAAYQPRRPRRAGGRPGLPRRSRFRTWPAGPGDDRLDPAAAQVRPDRRAAACRAAQHRAGPGRVRGRPGHRRAILSCPVSGTKPGNHDAARRWPAGPAAGTRNRPAGGSCRSARPGTGPAPPGPVTPRSGTGRGRSARQAPPGPDPRRRAARAAPRPRAGAPRTTAAPAATGHACLPASPHPARRRPGIISQVRSLDQRRCRLSTVFPFPDRSGRSRHGHPVRVRKKTPSITSR